jgi:hypothetical protein
MKAPVTLMWNKSKTLLVPVGDPEGKFLAYVEGTDIPDDSPLKVMPAAKNKMVEAPQRKSATEGKEK